MTTEHPQQEFGEERLAQEREKHGPSQLKDPNDRRPGAATFVTAGAVTALLSGDVRLAVRATRLLMDSDQPSAPETRPRSAFPRRAWRRPRARMRGNDKTPNP
jgi:hypothetical protein